MLEEISFTGLVVVAAVALLAPFLLGLAPSLRFPSIVLEIVAGSWSGPALLGWVEVDDASRWSRSSAWPSSCSWRDRDRLRAAARAPPAAGGLGFVLSFGIALASGSASGRAASSTHALLVAIVLCATSLGVVVAVLKDAGEVAPPSVSSSSPRAPSPTSRRCHPASLFFSGEEWDRLDAPPAGRLLVARAACRPRPARRGALAPHPR